MCVTETFGDPTQERVCHIRHKAFQAQGLSRKSYVSLYRQNVFSQSEKEEGKMEMTKLY
jgi:hypothetical protein